MPSVFPPGSSLGIVGGGQLGRMLAREARRKGYRVVVFTDEYPPSPAGQLATRDDLHGMEWGRDETCFEQAHVVNNLTLEGIQVIHIDNLRRSTKTLESAVLWDCLYQRPLATLE